MCSHLPQNFYGFTKPGSAAGVTTCNEQAVPKIIILLNLTNVLLNFNRYLGGVMT